MYVYSVWFGLLRLFSFFQFEEADIVGKLHAVCLHASTAQRACADWASLHISQPETCCWHGRAAPSDMNMLLFLPVGLHIFVHACTVNRYRSFTCSVQSVSNLQNKLFTCAVLKRPWPQTAYFSEFHEPQSVYVLLCFVPVCV